MDLKIYTDNIEESAKKQIERLKTHPAFKDQKVRIMPDVHPGAGCVIGFTSTIDKKVIPNLVGVDIGCGVASVKINEINIDLEQLDNVIKENIPSGFGTRESELNTPIELKNLYDKNYTTKGGCICKIIILKRIIPVLVNLYFLV